MQRAIGLRSAVAINVITMIGIGPLITIPLVLAALGGPLALVGWVAGAIVALCDGMVWAELASRFPGSGGTYVYLREAFGANGLGRALAFLFNWQFLLYAPCLLATGYIGFANYAAYFVPAIARMGWLHDAVALVVGVATIAVLYRRTARIAAASIVLAVAAISTLAFVIVAALPHAELARIFTLRGPIQWNYALLAGFGSALYITLYDYVGYADVALLGDEVLRPRRTIPLAVLLSVVLVAILYILLQISVLGVIPWQTLLDAHGLPTTQSQYVAALVVERTWGAWPARIATLLVLLTAFASLYGNLLGFSRIPYAAAREGNFFAYFAKLHPQKDFPSRALLTIGALSLVASLFPLDAVIAFLTAGIVLIQGLAQIVALVHLRLRAAPAPFRMPFYPFPAVVAFVGWSLAFWYTGASAMTVGVAWLGLGAIAYAFLAQRQRYWPFVALALAFAFMLPMQARAATGQWSTWRAPKPNFVYGAAFFYERTPRDEWERDLRAYKRMGVNTIDLYVMWNWHEPHAGQIDFNGATNPRRDLRGLLALIHKLHLHVILRPGPVIRNEWRNGGYPAWLLRNPAYNMPLHDILQGRYPATATLQNAHADAAAQEWLQNRTHLRASATWLRAVFRAAAPWSHEVIAIALDDDQGAYMNNDTWPAPHWHHYIAWLAHTVRASVGPRVPLFINTYQMKVTASAPVWAWGNWYQSDAYRIGDHDLAQLAFSTALLQTQPQRPVMVSEFQAGWLQGADEIAPRPAAPENTTLALHQMLQLGAHGIVNFPVQDTLNPAGWEAPWANWFYAWDAALTIGGTPSARYAPTAAFGNLVSRFGPILARLQPQSDVAIAWLVSAYDPALMDNARVGALAALTIAQQQRCRARALTCRFVDLRYDSLADLVKTRILVVPATGFPMRFEPRVERLLAQFGARGGIVVSSVDGASSHGADSSTGGIRDAALLVSPRRSVALFDVFNASTTNRSIASTVLHVRFNTAHAAPQTLHLPAITLAPGDACDVLFRRGHISASTCAHPFAISKFLPQVPNRPARGSTGTWVTAAWKPVAASATRARAYRLDVFKDGEPEVVLDNGIVRAVIAPDAGARAFIYQNDATGANAFTSIGAFRDDVQSPPMPSPRDYIAPYTHPIEAGTFNREYTCTIVRDDAPTVSVTCTYTAPDFSTQAVHFSKTFTLGAQRRTLTITLQASAPATSISAFTLDPQLQITWPKLGAATTLTHPGFQLSTLRYPANTPVSIRLSWPGPLAANANVR